MKKIALLSLLTLSTVSAKAAVDYSLCQDWLKKMPLSNSLKLSDDGVLKPEVQSTDISVSEKNPNLTVYTFSEVSPHEKKPAEKKAKVTKADMKLKIEKKDVGYAVKMDLMMKSGSDASMGADIDFELNVRNNKCYPSFVEVGFDSNNHFMKLLYKSIGSAKADTFKCREISEFFKKHPEVKSCAETQVMGKLSVILEGTEDLKEDGKLEKETNKKLAKVYQDVTKAKEILAACDTLKLSDSVADESLWVEGQGSKDSAPQSPVINR